MRVVQSFWSKPVFSIRKGSPDHRKSGGWTDLKSFYYSMTLSCLRALTVYRNVELYTDRIGKDLLIDRLGLPYSKVYVELNAVDQYDENLWAIGKIFVYSLQDEPFLHIDNDIFIWKRLGPVSKRADLLAQNIEYDKPFYREALNEIKEVFSFPDFVKSLNPLRSVISSNLGVTGGKRTTFFKEYSGEVFNFVDRNKRHFGQVSNLGFLNPVFEQFLFHQLAAARKIEIVNLFGDREPSDDELTAFSSAPSRCSYLHPYGKLHKRRRWVISNIEMALRFEYPEFYFRVKSLVNHL